MGLFLLFFISKVYAESYTLLDSQVKSYQVRVEEKRKKLAELAEKKATLKDDLAVRSVLDEMIVEAREMKETFKRFQKEKKRLQYSYPARGEETERKYKRFELATIEEFNTISNIDVRLKGVLARLEETYEKPPEVLEHERQLEEKRKKSQAQPKRSTVKENTKPVQQERPVLSY